MRKKNAAKKKNKIAIDARMIELTGIGTYIQNIISKGIYDIALGNEKVIRKYNADIKVVPFHAKLYGLKEQLLFPFIKLKKENVSLIHFPHYNVPLLYYGKYVVTIHDLTHLLFPEFLGSRIKRIYSRMLMNHAAGKARIVFTVSNNSKKDIIENFKIGENKVIVTYNAVDDDFRKKEKEDCMYLYNKFSIPKGKNIVLYVGNLKAHKNIDRLLEAFSKVSCKRDTILILAGKALIDSSVKNKIEKFKIEQKVICTGMVERKELIDLYNISDLFVFPSVYEGFGLPPLEAMACGTPVICSDNSSLPEVVGDSALKFDPYDVNMIKRCMENMLDNESLRQEYIEKGTKRVKEFSWNKTADLIKKQLEKL